MAHPRYAPSGFGRFSLTRIITSTAVVAAAALICGPALESAGRSTAAASVSQDGVAGAAGSVAGAGAGDSGAAASGTAGAAASAPSSAIWRGAIPIRPSKFASLVPLTSDAAQPGVVAEPAVFGPAGATGALGIPAMVLQAYHRAADKLAVEDASCKLPWWLLAGIGHTESGHAEDGRLTADGTTRGKILGPRLNGGIVGDAVISDTDHGAYDGDTVYDRAIGPMQFIPSTWLRWGADGNADGKRDPSNIFDATLAAGRYLCADGRDLSTAAGLQAAILSYNHSDPYLKTVLAWGTAYRSGASSVDDSLLPVVGDVTKVRPPVTSRPPKPKPAASGSGKPGSSAPGSGSHSSPIPSGGASSGGAPSGSGSGSASGSGSSSPSATPTPSGSGNSSGPSSAPTSSPTSPPCESPTGATSAPASGASASAAGTASPSATPTSCAP